jgi:hypothetical protein
MMFLMKMKKIQRMCLLKLMEMILVKLQVASEEQIL